MNETSQLNSALDGRYSIDREVGRGGMATVYLARDLRHQRRVALKVLNPELGAVLGVERFLSEIQVTANLQHPNLLPLFDSGQADGLLFYVMPYVEGESLRGRLDREKQLPIDDAVHIAASVCGALDYAHRHGVIHRDLKPENILLHEGQPLVADFGIALAVSNAGGARVTQTGISLGTPQYMSPEQATGDRPVDGRSDVYSLACVLYEMLTGEPPHIGNTVQSIIAKVITDKPQSARLRRDSVPEHVDAAMMRALAKFPADRFGTAQQFADALRGKIPALPSTARAASRRRRLSSAGIIALAVVALLTSASALWRWRGLPSNATLPASRFIITLPAGIALDNVYAPITISPDGRNLIFRGSTETGSALFLRNLDDIAVKPIAGTDNAAWPFVSSDNRWIAFVASDELRRMPIEGGPATSIANVPIGLMQGASWGSGDTIIMGSTPNSPGLTLVRASNGMRRPVTKLNPSAGEVQQRWPHVLDDGKTVLYTSWPKTGLAGSRIAVTSIETGESTILDLSGTAPLGVFDGQLLYVRADGALMAAQFDARKRTVRGEPRVVFEGVNLNSSAGNARIAIGGSTMVFLSGGGTNWLSILDTTGKGQGLSGAKRYFYPAWSPDGRRIALSGSLLGTLNVSNGDIWVLDLASGVITRLTTEGNNVFPMWSHDGRSIVYVSNRERGHFAVWRMPADGSGAPEKLFEAADDISEALLAPDDHTLVYRTGSTGNGQQRDVWYVDLSGDRKPKPFLVSRFNESEPRISPDGRWMAYQSDESGVTQVYVRPFPGPGGVTQVSVNGGIEPVWSRDGKRLFYRTVRALMAVEMEPGPRFSIRSRRTLFEGSFFTMPMAHPNYDVSPDGKRFIMLRTDDSAQIVVITNWMSVLRRGPS